MFLQHGSSFSVADSRDLVVVDKLPPGNYEVVEHPMTKDLYFTSVPSFSEPPRLYGNVHKTADRIMHTFLQRPNTTGVLLAGEKGSGKTQLARMLCTLALRHQIPTIILSKSWIENDKFSRLMGAIKQPHVLFFDEFEKTHKSEHQDKMLTFLDGTATSTRMVIFTCNDKWLISSHMRNRPGRIYYSIDYAGLAEDAIVEYCEDNLNDKHQIDRIVAASKLFNDFNFDMLKAIVEEMNRYNETVDQVISILNTRPTEDDGGKYDILVFKNGIEAKLDWPDSIDGSPLKRDRIHITTKDDEINLTLSDATKFDAAAGVFEFRKGEFVVQFKRRTIAKHPPFSLF